MNSRHALVTGASGSLGRFLCEDLLKKGYTVLGLDLIEPSVDVAPNPAFTFIKCDLTKSLETESALVGHMEKAGPFELVINNAGRIFNSPLVSFVDGKVVHHDFEAWDQVISINLSATFYVSACVIREMVAKRVKGVVINVSSICAAGNAGQVAYSAAKAGINAFTVALSKEVGPLGIRIAGIAPGFIDTTSTKKALSEEAISKIRKNIPLRRLGLAEEIANAVHFICSNTYYTGTVLELDGGLSI